MAEATTQPSGKRSRSYGPTVLVGLGGAGLAAVAAARDWATTAGDAAGMKVEASVTGAESQPLVPALALVALAAWGVVLVVRGPVRRLVASVGVLASTGALIDVVLAFAAVQDASVEAAMARGATRQALETGLTPWYHLTAVGALGAVLAFAVAVVRSPRWPAMGSRYDAPAARGPAATEEDMWRALDEGRDPTS
jgi:uncharacterized membrane protein (TIGR02234 family)